MTTPSFDISERHGPGDAVILALSGELDMATVGVLTKRLDDAARIRQPVVLDLSELQFIDSSGLRAFLKATAEASRDGWSFAITRAPERIRRVFDVAGVATFLPFVEP
jgi:anti-anti-sigma factor